MGTCHLHRPLPLAGTARRHRARQPRLHLLGFGRRRYSQYCRLRQERHHRHVHSSRRPRTAMHRLQHRRRHDLHQVRGESSHQEHHARRLPRPEGGVGRRLEGLVLHPRTRRRTLGTDISLHQPQDVDFALHLHCPHLRPWLQSRHLGVYRPLPHSVQGRTQMGADRQRQRWRPCCRLRHHVLCREVHRRQIHCRTLQLSPLGGPRHGRLRQRHLVWHRRPQGLHRMDEQSGLRRLPRLAMALLYDSSSRNGA